MEAGSSSLVRKVNASLVLRTLRQHGPLARSGLSSVTGLSQPTVNDIAAVLVRRGLVQERSAGGAEQPTRRGPKAGLLSFNAAAGYVLGIDISAEQVVVLLTDLAGQVVARHRLEPGSRAALRPEPLLTLAAGAVKATLRAARVARGKVMAVGMGVPAIIDPVSGRASLVPALPEWEGLAVGPRIQSSFGCPVIVNTDVHLASLAESRFGAARDEGNAVYVHLGVGIGLGILINGRLYPGFDGAAGQIGNLPIPDDEPPQAGFGMFEWAAGSTAFCRFGRRALERSRPGRPLFDLADGQADCIGPKLIADAAGLGDRDAMRIMARLIERLAQGLAAVICVLNPATVILGGEIAQLGTRLIEPLRARVAALVPRGPRHFVQSALGDGSVALGAVQVALQAVDERMFALPFSKAA